MNPADPSTEDRAFRAPYMAAELLACEARPVMRAIISSKCKDRPSLSGLQRLLLFADRPGQLRAYLAGYAVRAVEAIARTEPAATVQAVVSTPGVVAACTAHADEPACGRLLAALWRLPYTASDPLFRCGKLHAADPVTLAEALAAMLHPLAVEQPREQRAEPGSAPGSASGGAFPRLPLLVAPSDAPSDPTGLSPVPSLAAARDYAGDNALIVVQEVAAGARVGPGAGVFVLRDVTRGSGGVAGGEEAAAAAAASPEGASGVARARAAASAAGGGEGARLGAAKAVHSRVVSDEVSPGDTAAAAVAKQMRGEAAATPFARAAAAAAVGAVCADACARGVADLSATASVPASGPAALLAAAELVRHCQWVAGLCRGGLSSDADPGPARRKLPLFLRLFGTDASRGCLSIPGGVSRILSDADKSLTGATRVSPVQACTALLRWRCLRAADAAAAAHHCDTRLGLPSPLPPSVALPGRPAYTASLPPVPSRSGAPRLGSEAEAAARLLCALLAVPDEGVSRHLQDTGAVVSLLDAVEAFPWHSLLHASVADALSEVMSRGPHSLADHILRGADLPARFARMLRLTAWPHRLDLVGRPRPPGCATAAYPGLVMRVANAVEAAAARTTSCVGVKASVGGTSTGITLSADLLAWLESNEEWIFVSSGPLSVFNVLSGEYVAGVPPSANNLSSIDREGGAGGGGLLGRLASIDEMPSKFPDAN